MSQHECRDCGKRTSGCHSSCESYINYVKERKALNRKIYEERRKGWYNGKTRRTRSKVSSQIFSS